MQITTSSQTYEIIYHNCGYLLSFKGICCVYLFTYLFIYLKRKNNKVLKFQRKYGIQWRCINNSVKHLRQKFLRDCRVVLQVGFTRRPLRNLNFTFMFDCHSMYATVIVNTVNCIVMYGNTDILLTFSDMNFTLISRCGALLLVFLMFALIDLLNMQVRWLCPEIVLTPKKTDYFWLGCF